MKISDFRKLSNTVAKIVHAVSTCFQKVDFDEISVTYNAGFSAQLNFFYGSYDLDIHLFVHAHSNDLDVTIRKLHDGLLNEIDKNLTKLSKLEKKQQKKFLESKTYDVNDETLSALSALTMLRDIITEFKN